MVILCIRSHTLQIIGSSVVQRNAHGIQGISGIFNALHLISTVPLLVILRIAAQAGRTVRDENDIAGAAGLFLLRAVIQKIIGFLQGSGIVRAAICIHLVKRSIDSGQIVSQILRDFDCLVVRSATMVTVCKPDHSKAVTAIFFQNRFSKLLANILCRIDAGCHALFTGAIIRHIRKGESRKFPLIVLSSAGAAFVDNNSCTP